MNNQKEKEKETENDENAHRVGDVYYIGRTEQDILSPLPSSPTPNTQSSSSSSTNPNQTDQKAGNFILYHHAGVVTEVKDGRIVEMLDVTDPADGSVNLKTITLGPGVTITVRRLTDGNIDSVFNGQKSFRHSRGPTDHKEIEKVKERIRLVKNRKTWDYHLIFNNCQHFASYVRSGNPDSDDVDTLRNALAFGIRDGISAVDSFLSNRTVRSALDYQPFSNAGIECIGNMLVKLVSFLIILLLILIILFVVTGLSTLYHYIRRQQQPRPPQAVRDMLPPQNN